MSDAVESKLVSLIPSLEGPDCNIETIESGIRISFYDEQVFDIFEIGGWVQVGLALLAEDELDEVVYREDVDRFLLELNSRCLGCRFAFDPEGVLLIVEDIPLDQVDEHRINESLDSISFVAYVFYDLIIETGRSGIAPSDEEVDAVVTEKEADHDKYH
jgi:hypothetical protein